MDPVTDLSEKPSGAGKRPSRRRFLKIALGAGGALAAGAGAYAWRSNTLAVSRETHALPGWKGPDLRVVSLSDIHAPGYGDVRPLVERTAALEPDLLFLVGDVLDGRGGVSAVEAFGAVKARFGKFAVLGNWDSWAGIPQPEQRALYRRAGTTLLVNEWREAAGIAVAGLDDLLAGEPDLHVLEAAAATGLPLLALGHAPALFETAAARLKRPLLMISGHTHGGQIAPFGIAPHRPRGSGPFLRGWYRRGPHALYVMRGVGTTIVPLRIGSRPEILVLTLRGEGAL
jgi:predicted MPP superfamily phosphohydrolase